MDTRDLLIRIYEQLFRARGHQRWWPGDGPFEIVVGAVLTQNTAWVNVERAIANLKAANALDPHRLANLPHERLASLIRPAGYFNVKARRLRAVVEFVLREGGGDVRAIGRAEDTLRLRRRLLEVPGVGRETADSILLYALKRPIFVVDAYTRRMFSRIGLVDAASDYDEIRTVFEQHLPADVDLFNDYHAQIVVHGKETCRPRPRCGSCVVREFCGWDSPIAGPAARARKKDRWNRTPEAGPRIPDSGVRTPER